MFIIEYAIERSKMEILEDMSSGIVPTTVSSFSELHDHVDANEYGGLCDPDSWYGTHWEVEAKLYNDGLYIRHLDEANAIQNAVDTWLQDRANT